MQLLAENNILSKREFKDKNGHIVKTTSKESGIVEYIAIDDTVNEITAKGRFLPSIMDRRAIKTVVNFNGKTEAGMRKLVQSVTAMPFVELGELKGFTETVRFQVSYKELYTYKDNVDGDKTAADAFLENFKQYLQNYTSQQQSEFEAWVETIKGILDDETAGKLLLYIQELQERADVMEKIAATNEVIQNMATSDDELIVTDNGERICARKIFATL